MGNIEVTPEELIRARYRKLSKRSESRARKVKKRAKRAGKRRPAKGSVHAVSGGLPGLGKRR